KLKTAPQTSHFVSALASIRSSRMKVVSGRYSKIWQPRPLWIFVLACAVPLAFAVYTQHAWEDFYITFRASRNLATGEGLVFNVGDRLQTFTSPIQALLLALSSLLTGNGSDWAALWLYRTLSIPAFGLAVALLFATTVRLGYPTFASLVLVGCLL